MHIETKILEAHNLYVRGPIDDGDFLPPKQVEHDELDRRLVAEVDRDSDLTAYTGYAAEEYSADMDSAPTGANLEILFSRRKGLAAVLYDNPKISAAFVEWVKCTSPDAAIIEWRKKVITRATIIRGDINQIVNERSST